MMNDAPRNELDAFIRGCGMAYDRLNSDDKIRAALAMIGFIAEGARAIANDAHGRHVLASKMQRVAENLENMGKAVT